MALRDPSGPGLSEDDPIVLVVGADDAEKRSTNTARSKGLPEAVTAEPRYGANGNLIIYRAHPRYSSLSISLLPALRGRRCNGF